MALAHRAHSAHAQMRQFDIDDDEVAPFAQSLGAMPALTSVDMGNNKIGVQGGRALGLMIQRSVRLFLSFFLFFFFPLFVCVFFRAHVVLKGPTTKES